MIQNKFLIYPNKSDVESDKSKFRTDAIVFISGDEEHHKDKSIYINGVYYDFYTTPNSDEIYDLIKDKLSDDFAISEATNDVSGSIKLSSLGPAPNQLSDDDKYGLRLQNGHAFVYVPQAKPIIPEVKDGVSSFVSQVFKRSNTAPERPEGGSYEYPYPDESYGWSDSVPPDQENQIIWCCTRVFSTDGSYPQTDQWTEPANISNSSDIDILWNLYNGSYTPNEPSTNYIARTDGTMPDAWITSSEIGGGTVIWMAIRTVKNGIADKWVVTRILGEKGQDGNSFKVKSSVSSLSELYSNYSSENEGVSFTFNVNDSTPYGEKRYDNHMFILTDFSLQNILGEAWLDLGSIKGADGKNGIDGKPGDNGKTAWYHVKFTDNELCLTRPDLVSASELTENPKTYMGYYVDYSTTPTEDSNNASDYTWGRCKGDDGFGYQYIYTLCSSETDIPCPKYSGKKESEGDKIGYGGGTQTVEIDGVQTQIVWTDNQESVSYEYPYCYRVWIRTDIQDVDGYWNGSKNNESSKLAVLVAKYGKDGENGKPGQDGQPGNDGVDGKDGKSVTIKASLASINGLPSSGAISGDGYLIDGDLWVYTGTSIEDSTHHNGFENVGKIKGEKGDKGDTGNPAYEYVVVQYTPSIVTFDEVIDDKDAAKTYTVIASIYYRGSELDDYSDFESDAENCKLSITDTKNCTVSNNTDLSGIILQMDVIKNSKTGWPDSGYFDFTIEYQNQTVKSRVSFVVNKIGTIYTTVNNGVQSTIANKVKTYVDEQGYVTANEMNTAINASAEGLDAKITNVSTVANEAKTNASQAKATADGFETRVSTIEHQGSDMSSRLSTVESEITQTNSKIDAAVKKNDLETVGIHLDGDNSTIDLVADKTTIGGNTFITSDGKISSKYVEAQDVEAYSITTKQDGNAGAYIGIENGVIKMFVADWPFPALTIRADYGYGDTNNLTYLPRMSFYDRNGFVKCSIDIDGVHTYRGNGTWREFNAFKISKMYNTNNDSTDTTITSFVGWARWLKSAIDYCSNDWLIPTDGVSKDKVIDGVPSDGVAPMILTNECIIGKTIGYCLADDNRHTIAVQSLYQYIAPRNSEGNITLDNNNDFTQQQALQIDGKVFTKKITSNDFSNGDVTQYYPEGLYINDDAMIIDGYPTSITEDSQLVNAVNTGDVTSITLPLMKVATMVISNGQIQEVNLNDRNNTSSVNHPFLYSKASKTYTGDELKKLFGIL